MGQVVSFPRTISFTRQFEELALYSEKTRSGDLFFAGLLDGSIEVTFDHTGAWDITDIHIKVDNGRWGMRAEVKVVQVDADENPALYWLLLDVLTDKYASTIDEWVQIEADDRGLRIAA
jgi:hypothetical protein